MNRPGPCVVRVWAAAVVTLFFVGTDICLRAVHHRCMTFVERGLYLVGGAGIVAVLAWIGVTRDLSVWNSAAGVLSCAMVAAGWILHAVFSRRGGTDPNGAGDVIEQHGVRTTKAVIGKSGWRRSRDRISQHRIHTEGDVIGKQEHPPTDPP